MQHNKTFQAHLQNYLLENTDCDKKQIEDILSIFSIRKYAKKERVVYFEGQFDKVFYIHSGILRLFYIDHEGGEHNKEFYSENQIIFPMTPLFQKQSSLFNIEVIKTVSASVCNVESFQSRLSSHGHWEKFILQILDKKMYTMARRQYEFLACSATERYQNLCLQYPHLIQLIPDYHIASYLGISNVSLSRIKKSMPF